MGYRDDYVQGFRGIPTRSKQLKTASTLTLVSRAWLADCQSNDHLSPTLTPKLPIISIVVPFWGNLLGSLI